LEYDLPVPGYAWHVVVATPQSVVQQLALEIAARLFGVIVVVGALVLVLVYAMSFRITQPLRMMAAAAQSIARGNLSQVVDVDGDDEIAQLARSFESMRRSLKVRLDESALLLKTSQSVASSFDLAEVMPPILEGIRTINQADLVRLVLTLLDEEQASTRSYMAGQDTGQWSRLDSQVLALSQNRGRFTLENPSRARTVLDMHAISEPLEALMALPLRNEDQFMGVLWIGHRQPHAFTADELNLLSILVGQLAVAVSNATLFQQAEKQRRQLAAVLEATPDAVLVINPSGQIALANPAAEMVLREEAQDCHGVHYSECIQPPALIKLLEDDGEGVKTAEIPVDDSQVLFGSVLDIRLRESDLSGKVCVLWDITHFKKLDALKSEFVSTVSHDLRAPLTVIRGYLTMLTVVGDMNEQQKDFVNKILTSVEHMGELVNNLLDLGRIEAGVALNLERLPIETIVREVIAAYRPQAVNKKIALDVDLIDNPQLVEVDAALLRQALANLVDNAIQYTPSGGRVTLTAHQQDENQIISVIDTGAGISPTDQARLFEKFFRARSRETFEVRGSGLGLAIVKSIVEQHGGTVQVDSRLGTGSRFMIVIPISSPGSDR
jgi:signal transduction histidine kinase/HAMP domain-containing protein